MTDEMKTEIEHLFKDTEAAYHHSDIRRKYRNEWYYSIASTALKENSVLLTGFNWGAGKDDKYGRQTITGLTKSFRELKDELGSFKRAYNKLEKQFSEEKFNNIVQTNFCFFRSEKEHQISKKDLDITASLFERLLHILKPELILSFSKKLYAYLSTTGKLCVKIEKLNSNGKQFEIAKGTYRMANENIPIFFLPHPNAKLSSCAREQSWKFLFESFIE